MLWVVYCVGALSSKAKLGLMRGNVEYQGLRRLPHAGVPEIVSRLRPCYSTCGIREISDDHHFGSQLGEDGVGGWVTISGTPA